MGFSREEYWSGLPYPPLGDLPDPGVKSLALPGEFFTTSITWEACDPGQTVRSMLQGRWLQGTGSSIKESLVWTRESPT